MIIGPKKFRPSHAIATLTHSLRPLPMNDKSIERLLSRMYNWKMQSAHTIALHIDGFPEDALSILKEMADE